MNANQQQTYQCDTCSEVFYYPVGWERPIRCVSCWKKLDAIERAFKLAKMPPWVRFLAILSDRFDRWMWGPEAEFE